MWNYFKSLFRPKGGVPHVGTILVAALTVSISTFLLLFRLAGLHNALSLEENLAAFLKSSLQIPMALPIGIAVFVNCIIALALSLVALFYARRRGLSFYRLDGQLLHRDQVDILLRVETFQTIFMPFLEELGHDKLDACFYEGGRHAGKKFGVHFPETYRRSIREPNQPSWDELAFQHRLDLWEEHDQNAGWGDIRIVHAQHGVTIQITHPYLFRDAIGNGWSRFMAGYIEALLNEISVPRGRVRFDKNKPIDNQGTYITLQFRFD